MKSLEKLVRDDRGATAIEYGLIASLIAVTIVTGATAVGTKLDSTFSGVQGKLKTP